VSQLGLVTQMRGMKLWQIGLLFRCAEDGKLACGRRSENILEPLTHGRYLYSDLISSYYIFSIYYSTRGMTLMRQKRLDELREI